MAADKNPGTIGENDDVNFPSPTSASRDQLKANSNNHEKDGQNVLYGDGHVQWCHTAFAGGRDDNIFNNRNRQVMASPVDKDDSVLLPTDG